MNQDLYNLVVGVSGVLISTLGGALLKAVWDGLKELRVADEKLTNKIQELQTLVVGSYVREDVFIRYTDIITAQLHRTEDVLAKKLDDLGDKLDNKVDKSDCDICSNNRRSGHDRRGP